MIVAGFRYAFSLTHHRHDAEDLVQQACLQVLRRKHVIHGKSYLFVAIRNLYYDECRRRPLTRTERLDGRDVVDPNQNHARAVNGRIDIETLLGGIPSADRELLFLHGVEGFTAAEIGEITGHPRGTILSRLSRIKRKLSRRFRRPSILEEVP